MIIDILHVINMVIIFCTAIKRDVVTVTECGEIAKAYIMSLLFFVDIFATYPTLFTNYTVPSLYYFKILRILEFERAINIIERFINRIKDSTSTKNSTI
jgi:hypothetical protein